MSTIGDLLDRLYRDYLDSPADQDIQTNIATLVTDAQTTVVYAADLGPEEIARMSVGTRVEMGVELMRITAHNESTRTLTVSRTDPIEHPANTLMRVAPSMPRKGVFDMIGDEIEGLSPPLYGEASTWADPIDGSVEIPASPEPLDVLGATQFLAGNPVDIEARIVRDELAFTTGVGIIYVPRSDEDINLRYSVAPTRPSAVSDTYASLGVRTEWERAIIYGVLSGVFLQPDLDHRTQEFITEALQSQGFPPTTGTNLAVALSRMRDAEVRKARDRLRARNRPRTDYRSVL